MITTKTWFREHVLGPSNDVFYDNSITGKMDNYYLHTRINTFDPKHCVEYYDKPLALFLIDKVGSIYFCLAMEEDLDEYYEIYRYYKVSHSLYINFTKAVHVDGLKINVGYDYLFNLLCECWFDIKFMWKRDDD